MNNITTLRIREKVIPMAKAENFQMTIDLGFSDKLKKESFEAKELLLSLIKLNQLFGKIKGDEKKIPKEPIEITEVEVYSFKDNCYDIMYYYEIENEKHSIFMSGEKGALSFITVNAPE